MTTEWRIWLGTRIGHQPIGDGVIIQLPDDADEDEVYRACATLMLHVYWFHENDEGEKFIRVYPR